MTPIINLTIYPYKDFPIGYNLDMYIAKSGISYQPIQRVSKTITTMDGTDHRRWVEKRSISVSLFEVNKHIKDEIETVLFPEGTNVVYVTCTLQFHDTWEGYFYVTGWNPKIKTIEAGMPYYEGLSFTLEEK